MRYQKIMSQIWNDERFDILNDREKLFYLYVLTSPHGNLIGMYVLKEGYAKSDLKHLGKSFRRDLKRLCDIGLIMYDPKNEIIYIPNFIKHNPITNPNQKKAVKKIFNELPKSFLLNEFIKKNEGLMKELNEGLKQELNEVLSYTEEDTEEEEEVSTQTKDFDFVSSLKINPAYSHINLEIELSKMDAWLLLPKNKGRKKTSRFILNWINKIEKPFQISQPQTKEGPPPEIIPKDFIPDPEGQKKLQKIIGDLSKKMTTPDSKEIDTRAKLEAQKKELGL